jgi:hypothetical protein
MVIGQLTIGNLMIGHLRADHLRADHRMIGNLMTGHLMIGHRQGKAGNSMDLFSGLLNRPVYWGGEPAKVE